MITTGTVALSALTYRVRRTSWGRSRGLHMIGLTDGRVFCARVQPVLYARKNRALPLRELGEGSEVRLLVENDWLVAIQVLAEVVEPSPFEQTA